MRDAAFFDPGKHLLPARPPPGEATHTKGSPMRSNTDGSRRQHWQHVYASKKPTQVGWYAPRLDASLQYITAHAALPDPIYDIGGGASTLADDLLALDYRDITVVDIADAALQAAQKRLGKAAQAVRWIAGDITRLSLPEQGCALWHDRAAFHFLREESERQRYRAAMERAVRPGGHAVLAVFGPEGPTACSGLPTARYDADALAAVFANVFALLESRLEVHTTPFGAQQQFLYACFRRQ